MGLLYIMYRGNISRGLIRGLYKGSICTIWGTNEDHIRLRPKVRSSILGSLYGKAKDLNNNLNGISPTNGRINKEVKPDIRIVPITLRQLHIKQLGIIVTSYTVYI